MKKRGIQKATVVLLITLIVVSGLGPSVFAATQRQRDRMIYYAESQVGIKTGEAEYAVYEWCAYFVSWCARKADIPVNVISNSGWVPNHVKQAQQSGTYYAYGSYTPRSGDLMICDWNNSGSQAHIAIVTEVNGSKVTTIGGNEGSPAQVIKRTVTTGGANRSPQVIGYISPAYATEPTFTGTLDRFNPDIVGNTLRLKGSALADGGDHTVTKLTYRFDDGQETVLGTYTSGGRVTFDKEVSVAGLTEGRHNITLTAYQDDFSGIIAEAAFTVIRNLQYTTSGTEATITGHTGAVEHLVIPEYIQNYRVTRIADNALDNTIANLKSITIPEGVTFNASVFAKRSADLVFKVYENSDAHQFALANEIKVELLKKPMSGVPTLSGIAQYGKSLTAVTTGVTPGDGSLKYQWYRADQPYETGSAIAGATSKTYPLASADVGKYVYVVVTPKADAPYQGSAKSACTDMIKKAVGPEAPVFTHSYSSTESSITISVTKGVQYGIATMDKLDALSWTPAISQSGSYTFEGLRTDEEYHIFARIAETATHEAGKMSAVLIARTQGPDITVTDDRWSGSSRYATAIAISRASYPDGSDVVFLVDGLNYPDALAVSALAYKLSGPVLMVNTAENRIDSATMGEISRLGVKEVYVLGGRAAISDKAVDQFGGAVKLTRIAGDDRYETAAKVAEYLAVEMQKSKTVFIANGLNYPDALSASSAAGKYGYPILFARKDGIPDQTMKVINKHGIQKAYIVGGTAVLGSEVESALKKAGIEVVRLSGDDRMLTALKIQQTFYAKTETVFAATGYNYADALTGGAAAAKLDAPLILTHQKAAQMPKAVLDYIGTAGAKKVVVFGGRSAVSDEVKNLLKKQL